MFMFYHQETSFPLCSFFPEILGEKPSLLPPQASPLPQFLFLPCGPYSLSFPLFFVCSILPSSYFSPYYIDVLQSAFVHLHLTAVPLGSLCGCLLVCTGTHGVFREHTLLFVSPSLPRMLPFTRASTPASPLNLLL